MEVYLGEDGYLQVAMLLRRKMKRLTKTVLEWSSRNHRGPRRPPDRWDKDIRRFAGVNWQRIAQDQRLAHLSNLKAEPLALVLCDPTNSCGATNARTPPPPHQGEPGSIPGGVAPGFRMWETCRTVPLVGGFSRGSPVSSTLCIPPLLHAHLASPSSVQISSFHTNFSTELGFHAGAVEAVIVAGSLKPRRSSCPAEMRLVTTLPRRKACREGGPDNDGDCPCLEGGARGGHRRTDQNNKPEYIIHIRTRVCEVVGGVREGERPWVGLEEGNECTPAWGNFRHANVDEQIYFVYQYPRSVNLRVQGQEARERYGRHEHARLVPYRSYAQGVQCFRRSPYSPAHDSAMHNQEHRDIYPPATKNVLLLLIADTAEQPATSEYPTATKQSIHLTAKILGRRVFSENSRFPSPFIPALLHTDLTSPSSVFKTPMHERLERGRVVGQKEAQWSLCQTACYVECCDRTVRLCWDQWDQDAIFQHRKGSGKPRMTTRIEKLSSSNRCYRDSFHHQRHAAASPRSIYAHDCEATCTFREHTDGTAVLLEFLLLHVFLHKARLQLGIFQQDKVRQRSWRRELNIAAKSTISVSDTNVSTFTPEKLNYVTQQTPFDTTYVETLLMNTLGDKCHIIDVYLQDYDQVPSYIQTHVGDGGLQRRGTHLSDGLRRDASDCVRSTFGRADTVIVITPLPSPL
ncbi:hypothetical protein PR048_017065 [Dryococelus australis]|uniref:Uncharacterized protein n=1 Tax=Dryococelus australis TaxID=614101 RepID=A0ABQ9H8I4_9NEOP|nr:hypothetical protein PR048_017065 [Dryococelus australis]